MSSERFYRITQNRIAQRRLDSAAVHDIGFSAKQFLDKEADAGVVEEVEGTGRIEFHENVDIAFLAGFAAGDGAEYGGVKNNERLQILTMS